MHDLTAAVRFSDLFLGFYAVMPWLEWCPDPQQPDAQCVKVFYPGLWTLQGHLHTYREWKLFPKQVYSSDGVPSTVQLWYTRDWTTEGHRRVAAPEPNLNQTLHHFFTLIIKAWLHSHHFWICPRNSWRRSCDHLMHQSSPPRISDACRRALASSLTIGRSEHLGLINLYTAQMNAKDSQNRIRLPAGPVVRTSKASRFLKRMQISLLNTCLASKWCCHVDFRACHLSFAHHSRLALCSQLDPLSWFNPSSIFTAPWRSMPRPRSLAPMVLNHHGWSIHSGMDVKIYTPGKL